MNNKVNFINKHFQLLNLQINTWLNFEPKDWSKQVINWYVSFNVFLQLEVYLTMLKIGEYLSLEIC